MLTGQAVHSAMVSQGTFAVGQNVPAGQKNAVVMDAPHDAPTAWHLPFAAQNCGVLPWQHSHVKGLKTEVGLAHLGTQLPLQKSKGPPRP